MCRLCTSGPVLERPGDLAALLTNLVDYSLYPTFCPLEHFYAYVILPNIHSAGFYEIGREFRFKQQYLMRALRIIVFLKLQYFHFEYIELSIGFFWWPVPPLEFTQPCNNIRREPFAYLFCRNAADY